MTVSQHSLSQSVWAATAGWWLFALWGIAGVLLGVWLLFQPVASALVLVTIVAVFWLIGGIVEIVGALVQRSAHWIWRIAGGAFSALVGLFVLAHPLVGTLAAVSALYLLVAACALVNGVVGLVAAERTTARIVLSIFQIVLACLMLVGFSDIVALVALVQAIGLILIAGSVVVAMAAFYGRRHASVSV
jgi:uncharacterized membrane protein HdeD (DUF308 family)